MRLLDCLAFKAYVHINMQHTCTYAATTTCISFELMEDAADTEESRSTLSTADQARPHQQVKKKKATADLHWYHCRRFPLC